MTMDKVACNKRSCPSDYCQLQQTRKALYNLVVAHNGYRHGMGPCICAAHDEARQILGMGRDDAMPKDLRGHSATAPTTEKT